MKRSSKQPLFHSAIISAFVFSIVISPTSKANDIKDLDIFTSHPTLYYRNVEGSLRNAPSKNWVNRWRHLDGVITKAESEETKPFGENSKETLKLFKETYPNKALILHFNGRARLPDFNPGNMRAEDFLYFVGSRNASSVKRNEKVSHIKVDDISKFSRKKNLKQNVFEDVVLVEVNSNGTFDWSKSEHGKLISINEKHSELVIERDLLGTGQISSDTNRVYIAMHVAKGPFGGNTQRLWEYNWFREGLVNNLNGLSKRLANELADIITIKQPYFDGLVLDVLTEHHTAGIGGYNLQLDIDSDGKTDKALDFNLSHQLGIYKFLAQLRKAVGTEKLLLADGQYLNQRAIGELNGIESEGWPTYNDGELEHWSSGLNRHRYWHAFAKGPVFSYMKLGEYFDENREKYLPSDSIRRLTVAAAALTDSAIAPTFKVNNKPFHRWPEFIEFGRLGSPLSEAIIVPTGNTITYKEETLNWNKESWQMQYPSLNSSSAESTKAQCLKLPHHIGDRTIAIESTISPESGLPLSRPNILIASLSKDEPRYSYNGTTLFNSWFNWNDADSDELCLGSDSDTPVKVEQLTVIDGPMVVARAFSSGILITNISKNKASIDKEWLRVKFPESSLAKSDSPSEIILPGKSATVLK